MKIIRMSLFTTLKIIFSHPLNKGRKGRAFLRYLKWQIGSRLVPGEVIYDWVGGAKFIVCPGETGLTQNIYCGLQEFQEMAYVLHVLNAGDLFVDVGANAGAYTLLACAVRGARGCCFEPVPSTFRRLLANLRLNDLMESVQAYNIGLADKEGELLFTSGLDTTNHVITKGELTKDTIRVKVLPLDEILNGEVPAVIKIDVEGFEALVVEGMLHTLKNPSLHSVIMELNGQSQRYGFNDDSIIEKMLAFGFRMYAYEPFSKELTSASKQNMNSNNALFLRNEEFILNRLSSAPAIKFSSF